MKRNIVPLLGIAFVVAIICTGVFYGLFAGRLKSNVGELPGQSIVVAARKLERGTVLQPGDLKVSEVKGTLKGSFPKAEDVVGATLLEPVDQNEPLLEQRVASLNPKAGKAGGPVPPGMRAVSLRVSESAGIVGLLRPGVRVDIQAVLERNNTAELRTILQNIEVVSVNPQVEPAAGNRPPGVVVTILAKAQDVDVIALADSGSRLRFALRNPLDDGAQARRPLALGAIFQGAGAAPSLGSPAVATGTTQAQPSADATPLWDHPLQLRVQALGVSAAALSELDSRLGASGKDGALQVASFRPDIDTNALVQTLEQKQELEVVSAWRLMAGLGRPIAFKAGTGANQLSVWFSPKADAAGKVSLRVKPEISLQSGEGIETRKYDAGVPDGGSFLVKGWLKDSRDQRVLEGLFPGHSWSGKELVILVTSRPPKEVAASALVPANRGH